MYKSFLRIICGLTLLSTFWSEIRLFDVSIFEWLAALAIPLAWIYSPKNRGAPVENFTLGILGIVLLSFAGVISSQSSFDATEHVTKVIKLVGAFTLILGLVYVQANRKIFDMVEVFYLLSISAAVCSFVAILQGQFGLLTNLIPRPDGSNFETWTRMTGLAEHPIETGLVSAYGIAIALGLGIHRRKWLLISVFIAIDAYSMRYSASLTAVFASLAAATAMCLYTKSYRLIVTGAVLGSLGIAVVAATSGGSGGLLSDRLSSLYSSQGNYETVQSREMQLERTIELIEPATLLIGNGYSEADLPFHREIHNGILASIFHFGILGLVSQCLIIGFFLVKIRSNAARGLKSILLGCIIVFGMAYLSGPPQARPSLWAPLLFLGGYLVTSRKPPAVPSKVSQKPRLASVGASTVRMNQ